VPVTPGAAAEQAVGPGRYVYCLAGEPPAAADVLGPIGLDGRVVYALPAGGIAAIVHDCSAEPYHTEDDGLAAGWVLAHHRVVELAWERWEAVLPMTFNTIVAAPPGEAPDRPLRAWLDAERAGLSARLDAVRGRAEYGLQVFWDDAQVARADAARPAAPGEPEAAGRSRGIAYLYRQRRERDARRAAGGPGEAFAVSLRERVGDHAERVRLERLGDAPVGLRMVVNLSCLCPPAREPELSAIVAELAELDGQEARLVGPLPPYSFAR
jgi:hypothetical protein